MDYYDTYLAWYTADAVDEKTKEELFSISRDRKEIEERFYKELEFGTAGLRGLIGAGTNRMNRYVVRRATQGLANYILSFPDGSARGVCIAFDSRRFSKEFAEETAAVLAGNNIKVYLFSTLHSVPQLSFTLLRRSCIAGVVITASHNPKEYNGYKVYWDDGAQAAPEQASAIFDAINRVAPFTETRADFHEALDDGRIELIGASDDEAYYAAAEKLLTDPALVREKGGAFSLVYTPLNGTGAVPVKALFSRIGVKNLYLVPEQAEPDGEFPTLAAPNPEDPAAFSYGVKLAEAKGASAVFATDPDADRLGAAVRDHDGKWHTLTGNQIGALLIGHILSSRKAAGRLPKNGVIVKSIVSTSLADAIAKSYGLTVENVLTGFRFIGEKIAKYEKTGEKTFLFGFEESFGFLAGTHCRDKDAVSSAMLLAELCIRADALENKTLYDKLADLYETYGYYKERVSSYTLAGKEGLEKIASAMRALREKPLSSAAGFAVTEAADYENAAKTGLPRSNMLRYALENGAWIVVRPSGTEPKLKLYIAASEKDEKGVDALLGRLFDDMDATLKALLK